MYSKKDYKFVKFERSHLPAKKYNAVLQNKKTKRLVKVPFGASAYEQFKDSTMSGTVRVLTGALQQQGSWGFQEKGFISQTPRK